MLTCVIDEKIFQTLPGQGWRVLIKWYPDDPAEEEDDFPDITEEFVIAWVTAKVPRKAVRAASKRIHEYEDVIIAPLVRFPTGDDLVLLDNFGICRWTYIAPGEECTDRHFAQLNSLQHLERVSLG